MSILSNLFGIYLQEPNLILYIAVGVFAGIYVGAIPGLSGAMAISLLVSFTFGWDVFPALALMIGVHVGVAYGGARSAVLINIPGAPSAIMTAVDGYQLALQGKAGEAIGVATVQSVLGGFIGTLVLTLGAPSISQVALDFAARDYFILCIMGLVLVGSLGCESTPRGIFAAALGVMIGMIGIDFDTGQPRFTFGSIYLMSGVNYVCAMIGLFGISEAILQARDLFATPIKQEINKIFPEWKETKKHFPLTVRSSLLGAFIGALPGAGGDIAAVMAYGGAKKTIKNPERPFGKGAIEGVVAPEAANNAAVGGAYIPMLTLGIPGDGVTAIILGALFIHGLQPGPLLLREQPDMFGLIAGGFYIANVFLLIFGLQGIKLTSKLVEIRKVILMPIIVLLSIVGSYSINNNIADVYWTMFFGFVGYFLKLYDIPVGSLVLGIVLSPLLEGNYRRAMRTVGNQVAPFIAEFFIHPITLILSLSIIFIIFSQSVFVKDLCRNLFKKEKPIV